MWKGPNLFTRILHAILRRYLAKSSWPRNFQHLERSRSATEHFSFMRRVSCRTQVKLQHKLIVLPNCNMYEFAFKEKHHRGKKIPHAPSEVTTSVPATLEDPHYANKRYILYFHGGAFCLNRPRVYKTLLLELAKRTNSIVFAPAYRRSPENVWPAALEDCIDAYRYLLQERHIDPKKIIIAGDSAGGNLTIAVTMKSLKSESLPPPAGIVGFSPWLDLSTSGPSYTENKRSEAFLTLQSIQRAAWMYLNGNFNFDTFDFKVQDKLKDYCIEKGMPYVYGNEESKFKKRLTNPLVSPVYFDSRSEAMHNFPPLLLHAAAEELLLSDTLIFGRRLNALVNNGETNLSAKEMNDDILKDFQEYGRLSNASLEELGTNSYIYADDCKPVDGTLRRASVLVWGKQYHAFPAFIAIDRKNAKKCLTETAKWICDHIQC